ncbi:hypothetical protein CEXT_600311 [Caerostris extrusa]|uniref:Uncharacterized protein n=1 Tax=Caerostris extrusa TaxID=172846 RepID=A0AAV4Y1Z7_CAEEX|nr:hypothetical protein CEXT_600311 [Caerostris extrusa]
MTGRVSGTAEVMRGGRKRGEGQRYLIMDCCVGDSEGNFYGEQILSDSFSPTEGDAKVICYDFGQKEGRRQETWEGKIYGQFFSSVEKCKGLCFIHHRIFLRNPK